MCGEQIESVSFTSLAVSDPRSGEYITITIACWVHAEGSQFRVLENTLRRVDFYFQLRSIFHVYEGPDPKTCREIDVWELNGCTVEVRL